MLDKLDAQAAGLWTRFLADRRNHAARNLLVYSYLPLAPHLAIEAAIWWLIELVDAYRPRAHGPRFSLYAHPLLLAVPPS